MARLYRKRPVTVEAMQWDGTNAGELEEFMGDAYETWIPSADQIIVKTLEGELTASLGDYIIRGTQNEFYPCKPDIFAGIYEEV